MGGVAAAAAGGTAAAAGGMTCPTAVAPSAAPPSTVSVVCPTLTWSPARTGVGAEIRLPFTKVPFVEPRSSTISWPCAS